MLPSSDNLTIDHEEHPLEKAASINSRFTRLDEYLKTWYTGISPRYVDLVSDFAGQEFFLLDGEALLRSLFDDPMLDLGGSKGGNIPNFMPQSELSLMPGFQMLHFVYLVERFLQNLLRRRCVFAIVFFDGIFPSMILNIDIQILQMCVQ